nr:Fic/DOC family N-terminal domain-containing protein [Halomicroarcula amylolytica]
MRNVEIDDTAPGELISYGRESYYRPEPLPPSRDLALDTDFFELLADAVFWLGKLSGVSLKLDFSPVLYTSLLRKEAMESAEIEGANIDYNALYSLETRTLDESGENDSLESSIRDTGTKDNRKF